MELRYASKKRPVIASGIARCGAGTVAVEVWNRLDARTPTAVVILKPDYVRDVDLFVSRYQVRAFGS